MPTSNHSSSSTGRSPAQATHHRCQWLDCTLIFTDAEALYEHITTGHIGRKSAGTLSLECHWAGCSSKATKRDHLTSHARVHIDLKPHSCEICTKSFKRPQDLKKHEKIHTEEHHQHHKQSKAVTVTSGTPTSSGLPPPPAHAVASDKAHPLQQQQAPYPFAAFPPGYPPYHYVMAMQQQMYGSQHSGMPPPQLDLSQIIAQQSQLNAAASSGFPLPPFPGYGMPYGGASFGGSAQGLPAGMPLGPNGMPMFAGGPSAMPVGMQQQQQQHQHHQQHAHQQQQQPQQQQQAGLPAYGYGLPPPPFGYHPNQHQLHLPPQSQHHSSSSPAPPQQHSSLYPALPQSFASLYPPVVNAPEDVPSPAHSNHSSSHSNSRHSNYSNHSASVSPKVPSLSPPSNYYSPSPEQENIRRSLSGSAVAGTKRGFDEAAGDFLGDLKNKRFQDGETVGSQLDALSSFLLAPNDNVVPALTPSQDASSESSGSDYSRAEVDNINELLLSLGQNLDSHPTSFGTTFASAEPCYPAQQPVQPPQQQHQQHQQHQQQQHQQHQAAPPSLGPISYGSVYPSLPSMERIFAPVPHRAHQSIYPGEGYNNGLANIRLSKAPSAPSISANEMRVPNYRHVDRLGKAAPSSQDVELESMEVDEEDANDKAKGYSSSIRSTSLDVVASAPDELKLAPLNASTRRFTEGPRLPPIAQAISSTLPTTLPPIRELIGIAGLQERHAVSSGTSDSGSASSSGSSTTLYPSVSPPSSVARPVSSHGSVGGIERLTHRVTKLGVRAGTETEVKEEKSDAEDMDEEDHRSKKSRMDSPEVEVELSVVEEQKKAQRLAVIKALVLYVNETFRKQVARQAGVVVMA